jgi:hypothetical protein
MAPPKLGEAQDALLLVIDAGLPTATVVPLEHAEPMPPGGVVDDEHDPGSLPFITDSFLRTATGEILRRYRRAFGAQWHADPERLRTEAVALLARFGAVALVPGGVVVRPLVGRYRNTVAKVKQRATLF